MLPDEISSILLKRHDLVAEEISKINLSIDKIIDELKSVNYVLINNLSSYAKNTGIKNKIIENELLKDSQIIREYIYKIQNQKIGYRIGDPSAVLDIHDIIVLQNTRKCSFNHHASKDVRAIIPILHSDGKVSSTTLLDSYCETCKRYTILKSDFDRVVDIVMCEVIDQTSASVHNTNSDELEFKQRESILYRYGYNVKSKSSITTEQRHIILASVIEANILNRRQILDHLSMLIERGSKIPNWNEATKKWKDDRMYVQTYHLNEVPDVVFERIILKYKEDKSMELREQKDKNEMDK